MRPIHRSFLIAAVGACTLVGFAAVLPGCTILSALIGGEEAIKDLGSMPEQEWIAWRSTAVKEVAIVTQGFHDEGKIDSETLEKAASVLAVIGNKNAVEAGELSKWIDVQGWKSSILALAILHLDSKLVAGGAYVDGLLTARGKEVFIHLGAALNDIAS